MLYVLQRCFNKNVGIAVAMTTWQCYCNDNLAMLLQLGIASAMTTWQ